MPLDCAVLLDGAAQICWDRRREAVRQSPANWFAARLAVVSDSPFPAGVADPKVCGLGVAPPEPAVSVDVYEASLG